MITFSNRTSNGNFYYTNEILNIVISGGYSLDENNELVTINLSFGISDENSNLTNGMNGSLSGFRSGNDSNKMSFNININDTDFVLLGKALSVYASIVQSIKDNNVQSNEIEENNENSEQGE